MTIFFSQSREGHILIWDNVSFHRSAQVRNWFHDHARFTILYLPPYYPFLNPVEKLFSAWRGKVYDCKPHERMALLQAMEDACDDCHGRRKKWTKEHRGERTFSFLFENVANKTTNEETTVKLTGL